MTNQLLNNLSNRVEVTTEPKMSEHSSNRIPLVDSSAEIKLPGRVNCIECSDDALYLFVGHSRGLSVFSTSALTCVGTWQDERVEISSISSAFLGNLAYLFSTVDDMGVVLRMCIARLFVQHLENIYLIKTINETDDINQRSICAKLEIAKSGRFGAAVMRAGGYVWLDVYCFPQDVWIKELENKQDIISPQATDAKFSPIIFLMKIKPPEIPPGTTLKSPTDVLQRTDGATIIGSGQNHFISCQQWMSQEVAFRKMFAKPLNFEEPPQQKAETHSNCTFHFLFENVFESMPGEVQKADEIPIAVCLWWKSSSNLLQYPLLRTSKEKENGPKPDILWPNAQEILCSVVSSCTRFIVLGLEDQLVTIWDRHFGRPHANIVVPGDSAICRIKLGVQNPETTAFQSFSPKLQLVVCGKNGACYSVTAGPTGDTTTIVLAEREPVCVLEPLHQKLYLIGERKTSLASMINREEDESCLFIFSFSECSLMDEYNVTSPAGTEKETRTTLLSLEETCNRYFQERTETWKERNRNLAHQWEQLSKYSFK
ncbi:hypothetical protein DNTS_000488 [Danionella cerebrum]|uniref:WD repeat-containing protein 93 n=1 Tax=Danionella cerebrum TaxID=2873325 RepID=A0A553R4U7_9TELE|nr:hypothetical protein DNTS_000488 [Danionella translucida]